MRSLRANRAVVFFALTSSTDEGIVRSFDSNLVTLHKNLQQCSAKDIVFTSCDLLSF